MARADRALPLQQDRPIEDTLAQIAALGGDWQSEGSPLPAKVLRAIVRHLPTRPVPHSMETGTGRSTLLFSHLSRDHKVFTLCDGPSYSAVIACPILNREVVEFVTGPTQLTLPTHAFQHPLAVALLDGPHAFPFAELEYYYVYPHLAPGALLIVDDINIPTIFNLFAFLKDDEMFELVDVVGVTAFFRRTTAPVVSPTGNQWWTQGYNRRRFPVSGFPYWGSLVAKVHGYVPEPVRRVFTRALPAGVKQRISRLMAPEHWESESRG
jgi:methyltransferase family protein